MKDSISYICESLLIIAIVWYFLRALLSKDKAQIWSPLSVISLTYIYYCSVPFWLGTIAKYSINEVECNGYLFHIAALLSYLFILLGYIRRTNADFYNWNSYYTYYNVKKYGLVLFIIAMIGYSSFRGFHFTLSSSESKEELISGGLVYYCIFMIDMCAIAASLLLISLKVNWKQPLLYVIICLIFIQVIFAGARWLIITVVITMMSTYYLYPEAKRINFAFVGILMVVMFLGFSVMDQTRVRGRGLDLEKASTLNYNDIKTGSQENYSVYWFSMMAMNKIDETGERVYFDPFITAALMPIPRSIFPWKPDAGYVKNMEDKVFGKGLGGGAAFLNFVEYYMAFGWLGIIVMSFIIGWIARMFWDNYDNNRDSIGAIIALGAFSAVMYSVISRGYLAGSLPNVILVVYLPFWITSILRKYIFKSDLEPEDNDEDYSSTSGPSTFV